MLHPVWGPSALLSGGLQAFVGDPPRRSARDTVGQNVPVPAAVIVLAGPSGSGKSHLSRRLGLPTLNLDDFYKDGDDPTLPRLDLGGGAPIVDWDSPASWHHAHALDAIERLCTEAAAHKAAASAAGQGVVPCKAAGKCSGDAETGSTEEGAIEAVYVSG